MATIGTFVKSENGYIGYVKTLSLNVKAKFVPSEKGSDKAPDFRILAEGVEVGAARRKTSQNEVLSIKIDDPGLPAPLYAALVANPTGATYALIWSRRSAY